VRTVQAYKYFACPLQILHTSGRGLKRNPIRWNNRPFLGRLIVYSVSSVRTKVDPAVCDRVVKYGGRAVA
jgi:hypothetical protein